MYSTMVTALIRDTRSSQKYWHIVKLMGRSASHITLQVANQTQPDLYFIGEYLARDKVTLSAVIDTIADHILTSNKEGQNYGVILIPEGLLEWTPDVKQLILTLNNLLSETSYDATTIQEQLSGVERDLFQSFPLYIQNQLLMDRDSHGNVQLSRIETERLVIEMCQARLAQKDPNYHFHSLPHFYG